MYILLTHVTHTCLHSLILCYDTRCCWSVKSIRSTCCIISCWTAISSSCLRSFGPAYSSAAFTSQGKVVCIECSSSAQWLLCLFCWEPITYCIIQSLMCKYLHSPLYIMCIQWEGMLQLLYSGRFLRGLIFTVFMDNWPIVKIKPIKWARVCGMIVCISLHVMCNH